MPVGLKLCDLTSAGTHILKSLRWDEILLPEVWPSNQIRVYVDSLICDLWLGRGSLIFYHSWKKKKKNSQYQVTLVWVEKNRACTWEPTESLSAK